MTAEPAARESARGLRALPLRWRLSIITAAITLLAVVATSAAVVALVRGSLVDQLDDQLRTAIHEMSVTSGPPAPRGPSDYHVEFSSWDGTLVLQEEATTSYGRAPELPTLTKDEVEELDGAGFTVPSTHPPGERWRVIAQVATYTPDDAEGVVMVALPMTSVEETTIDMLRIMAVVGLAVVVVAALAGYVAVQRSLRPLRDIESAAQAVAAGDLSQRAPLEPPSTEVGRLGLSFNTMVAELEQAFAERAASEERMRRFVSDASHELRTPLAAIRGYGELYRWVRCPVTRCRPRWTGSRARRPAWVAWSTTCSRSPGSTRAAVFASPRSTCAPWRPTASPTSVRSTRPATRG